MARTFKRTSRMTAISEINVTPLLDLAFSLLIIFMIATPLLEQTIPLQLPVESQAPQPPREEEFQTVSISPEGLYYWGETEVSPEQMGELMARAASQPQPPVLRIRADGRLPYQRVVDLLNLAKQHQLSRISLDTVVK